MDSHFENCCLLWEDLVEISGVQNSLRLILDWLSKPRKRQHHTRLVSFGQQINIAVVRLLNKIPLM